MFHTPVRGPAQFHQPFLACPAALPLWSDRKLSSASPLLFFDVWCFFLPTLDFSYKCRRGRKWMAPSNPPTPPPTEVPAIPFSPASHLFQQSAARIPSGDRSKTAWVRCPVPAAAAGALPRHPRRPPGGPDGLAAGVPAELDGHPVPAATALSSRGEWVAFHTPHRRDVHRSAWRLRRMHPPPGAIQPPPILRREGGGLVPRGGLRHLLRGPGFDVRWVGIVKVMGGGVPDPLRPRIF